MGWSTISECLDKLLVSSGRVLTSLTLLAFVYDNPGVWIFHFHIDWHLLDASIAAYVIEALSKLKGTIGNIPADVKALCPAFFAPPTHSPTPTT